VKRTKVKPTDKSPVQHSRLSLSKQHNKNTYNFIKPANWHLTTRIQNFFRRHNDGR